MSANECISHKDKATHCGDFHAQLTKTTFRLALLDKSEDKQDLSATMYCSLVASHTDNCLSYLCIDNTFNCVAGIF